MAACRPLFVGVGPGCGEGERADGQELHPEEGIAYQTAEDGGALRSPSRKNWMEEKRISFGWGRMR